MNKLQKTIAIFSATMMFSGVMVTATPQANAAPQSASNAFYQGNLYIMGKSKLTAEQMTEFVFSKNPNPKVKDVQKIAELFLKIGNEEGVRGDIAFAQALKETGFFSFTGDVSPKQNNYSGIGAVGGGAAGANFKSEEEGVRAQIQHLKAYASDEDLNTDLADPRFRFVKRGSAKTWPSLHGKWAMQPNGNYGKEILDLYRSMSK